MSQDKLLHDSDSLFFQGRSNRKQLIKSLSRPSTRLWRCSHNLDGLTAGTGQFAPVGRRLGHTTPSRGLTCQQDPQPAQREQDKALQMMGPEVHGAGEGAEEAPQSYCALGGVETSARLGPYLLMLDLVTGKVKGGMKT